MAGQASQAGRSGVRSSARLSAGGGAAAAAAGGEEQRRAAAELRRARAARAAERAREVEDSPQELRDKCRRLARALRDAKHLVVYTGAGISTAADIPDYRGPRGVWTRLRRGERVARVEVARARPTFTHMALSALWARGALKFVVSQNCDGLHVRAGLPRRALAELHGDMFAERCAACRRVTLRAFDTTPRTARHAHGTRRLCHACGAELQDSIVHFGERGRAAWPLNWAGALRHAAAADVVLCLGSSLKVLRRYPRLWRMQGAPASRPALYIVNLQWTPKDAVAALKINARCDDVMAQVARRLRLRVPRYSPRADPLLAHAEPLAPPEAHTAPPAPPPPPAPAADEYYSLSSPSASDSDDDVPLRRLAERLRAPPAPPAPPAPGLRAFRVAMQAGETTILLRARHAPPPPPPAPASALRRFRMVRPPNGALNGHRPDLKTEPPPEAEPKAEPKAEPGDAWTLGSQLRRLLELPPLRAPEAEDGAAAALAAAIFQRAVLLCRAHLYPGLHTIIPPAPAPPAPPAECAWCLRRYAARRCLWYGPPLRTPPERRAWRRERGRRYLCACCGDAGEEAEAGAGAGAEGGGWYGKGYRKGRRKRR
ncbi:NAD-dependent protein deacetylase sirtuin-7 [Bicyclus anynana]|uniref:Regulatory protein SIR2 homolog 7 n=1 Tax=Bicyclus anynana TaxID=110368 RepID=A0ABM3LM05_BICAN|nr:NAD-dependent protein deacetylase sirtuin-7 [Bicyclus anynana]